MSGALYCLSLLRARATAPVILAWVFFSVKTFEAHSAAGCASMATRAALRMKRSVLLKCGHAVATAFGFFIPWKTSKEWRRARAFAATSGPSPVGAVVDSLPV